jgi:hypothetical protein
MTKTIFKKVMWLGRATTFLAGLAVILALTAGVASTALAGTGVGSAFNLGKTNTVSAISSLVGSVSGSNLLIDNNSTNSAATALNLQVEAGKAPMKVNSGTKVANLNADKIDGLSSEQIQAAYATVTTSPGLVSPTRGIASVSRLGTGDYCLEPAPGFQLRDRGVALTVDWNRTFAPESAASVMISAQCGTNGILIRTQRTTLSNNSLVSTSANDIGFRIVVAQ